jgi:hypothetical protein
MGEIVAAFGVCHSPHLLTRPPDEIPEQSEASIGAMPEMGKDPGKVSDLVPKFVEMGAHPLAALMGIHATYPAAKKYAQEKVGAKH